MQRNSNNLENVGLGIDLGGTKIAGALFNSKGMVSPKEVLYLENKTGQEVGEQDEPSISTASSTSTSSSDDNSSSPSADEYPPYPEVPKWGEHGQTPERGTANPLGVEKWGEKGQKPAKGAANSTF